MHKQKKVVVIAGPTAAGKTALAIEVARQLDTEIISADSRQCYREMNIGVARPSGQELAAVPHHFIASHSIGEKVTAATFEAYALQKAEHIFEEKEVLVMVGGTGMYIKAFAEGLDTMPLIPKSVRRDIQDNYNSHGLAWLQQRIRDLDPSFYEVGEVSNPHRLMRALEVVTFTGSSILSYRSGKKADRDFELIKVAITPPREQLHANINHRVDAMMQAGLLDEVQALFPYRHLNALQTVGYKELFQYMEHHNTLEGAVEDIKVNTRQYAKRQLTWFRKDKEFQWFDPGERDSLLKYVLQRV